jgi:hypothetical protein
MNLIIEASLCEPPSEVSCFRDVTLYGKIYIFEDILVQCPQGTRSIYWKWLKKHGAHDFISQMLKPSEKESGFNIATKKGNININKIACENISFIISSIKGIKQYG